MSSVVVTDFQKQGSYYYESENPKTISKLYTALSLLENENIQIVIISSPDDYKEYSPAKKVDRVDDLFMIAGGMSRGAV